MLPTFNKLFFQNQILLSKSVVYQSASLYKQLTPLNRALQNFQLSSQTQQKPKHSKYGTKVRASSSEQQTVAPLVVLVAWLGARERYFDKYVELWKSLGYETFSVRPPIYGNILPPLCYYSAQHTIDQLDVTIQQQQQRPLIFHVFSNGGFIYLANMLKVGLQKDHNPYWFANLRGVIFDSCPAKITPEMSARGVLSALFAKSTEQVEKDHKQIVKIGQATANIGLQIPLIQSRLRDVWDIWNYDSPICKQLYHYSTQDGLIPYKEVEQFMEKQQLRGCEVKGYNWQDSGHVSHYRSYPTAYRNTLSEFVDQINE